MKADFGITVIDTVNHCGKIGEIYQRDADGKLFCRDILEYDFEVLQWWNETREEIMYLYQSSKNLNYYPLVRSGSPDWFEENSPTHFHIDKEYVPF